ncbi:hypothetical protein niasHT_032885 [Heterodera trifolii]|uniref:F-box domain-containing protein n=1 Tax=Heterodera trifolii TaxID=157864 RepID=A0ABD2ILA5_9BILA
MSDNGNEAEEEMAQAIFISADCWLKVFELLPPSQLGLGIALISRRFDYYVDEHFKSRKWALKSMGIWRTIGENGTKQMQIANLDAKILPIPQVQLPGKVIGFKLIIMFSIDQNAIAFLQHFRSLFAACPINLLIKENSDRILMSIFRNIWPMIAKNICGMHLFPNIFRRLRQLAPSFLNKCPSLRIVNLYGTDVFPEFPCDDSAAASDGQAVAKWFFTPLQNDVPKVFECWMPKYNVDWRLKMSAFQSPFESASSPVNFIVVICFHWSHAVVPFALTNELTGEQLTFKKTDNRRFLLVRCPIARDADKWAKWEKEAIDWQIRDQWNQIGIKINDEDEIGDGLLDETPGSSDQQQQK